MRLYHFLKACHAIDDVEKSRIKISLWMDVNDPWELKPFDLSDARNLRAIAARQDWLGNDFPLNEWCRN